MDNMFEIQDDVLIKYTGSEAEVTIPDGIVEIGKNAFSNNDKLTTLVMPDSVTKIGSTAFFKCTKLKSITFSARLEEIGYQAFCRCKALKEVTLPSSLRYLGGSAFGYCSNLSAVHCDSKVFCPGSNPFFSSYGEPVLEKLLDKNGLLIFLNVVFYFRNPGDLRELTVPEGVTHIMDSVFRPSYDDLEQGRTLEKITLPDSVVYVGREAFANCKNLHTLRMPQGVEFGLNPFAGCQSLADENGLIIHDGILLNHLGSSDTVTVPEGVRFIAPELFRPRFGSSSIRSITLPESLEKIGFGAFQDCTLLESIRIPDNVHTIGNSAFAGCQHLTQVQLSDHIANIGEGLFSGCRNLADENGFLIISNILFGYFGADRTVEVPEGVTHIARDCFAGAGIFSIRLPSTLKTLGVAFRGCNLLEEITIPEGVTRIPDYCFSGCTNLKTVVLPASLRSLGSGAFDTCTALSNITLPEGLEELGSRVFFNCSSIQELTIPQGIKTLTYSLFDGCSSLTRVTLPLGLEVVDSCCFQRCSRLKQLDLPDSVHTLGYHLFTDANSLRKLNCGSIANIHPEAFQNCKTLADDQGFLIVSNILWAYTGPGGNVTVPDGVTELAPDVFREGTVYSRRAHRTYRPSGSLTGLTLPSTLRKIGRNALEGCGKLKQLELPAQTTVIDEEAFCKSGLERIRIGDGITQLDDGLFRECASLRQVELSSDLVRIGKETFLGCKSLKEFSIPAGVKYIGEDAFRDCHQLKQFRVDAENTAFGAWDGILTDKAGTTLICYPAGRKMTQLRIPEHFQTIADHAFISCKELKTVYIPESVKNMGNEVFPRRDWRGNTGLTVIEAHPNAGGGKIGTDIFCFQLWQNAPLVHPKLPLSLVKEQAAQVLLALAYCQNPASFEPEYAQGYQKYVVSHEKLLMKKAAALNLPQAMEFLASLDSGKKKKAINYKKLSEQAKVELLEQAVVEKDLAKVKEVINGCGKFEFTARALGLACLYSSLDIVKVLVENGATFSYTFDSSLKRKYGAAYSTTYNSYPVSYSSLIAKTSLNIYNPVLFANIHEFHFGTLPTITAQTNSEKARADIAQYLLSVPSADFNASEALSCALLWGCVPLARRLLELGVPLHGKSVALTATAVSAERNEHLLCLAALSPEKSLFALQTFAELLKNSGKQIVLIQKLFEEKNSPLMEPELLRFIFSSTDTSKLTKSKLLELAADRDDTAAIAVLVEAGVLKNAAQREKIIQYAMDNKNTAVLAWLMDYKNRTADLAAEEARKEKKAMRELFEDPNSVSALKKIWGYKKLEDGTLMITSYKGSDTQVQVPSKIGKASVTAIGERAFSGSDYGRWKNHMERRNIQSITIPEGVTEVGERAFSQCESLEQLSLPSTLKTVGKYAFLSCPGLVDEQGFVVINDTLYYYTAPDGKNDAIAIPEGVRRIAPYAIFAQWSSSSNSRIKSIQLPESLEVIDDHAFEGLLGLSSIHIGANVKTIGAYAFCRCGLKEVAFSEGLQRIEEGAFAATKLMSVRLPDSLEYLGKQAFYNCSSLRDFCVGAALTQIGEEILGNYGTSAGYSWNQYYPKGVYVYTPAGSAAHEHMKQYAGVIVSHGSPEEDKKG